MFPDRTTSAHPPVDRGLLINTYDLSNNKLLRRPLEPGQYTSFDYSQTLDDHGILGSIGSVGDAYDTQRARRELRRQLQDRADPRPRLANPNPARTRDRRVRRLVQHRTPPHPTRRRPTRRVPNPPRKTDRVTKSTEDLPLILRGNQPKQSPSNREAPAWSKLREVGYVRSKSVLFCSLRATLIECCGSELLQRWLPWFSAADRGRRRCRVATQPLPHLRRPSKIFLSSLATCPPD